MSPACPQHTLAVGAFMKVQALQGPAGAQDARKVRARFVERFSMGAPVMGGEVRGPAITGAPCSSDSLGALGLGLACSAAL